MHTSAFDYLQPAEQQKKDMEALRAAAKAYAEVIEHLVPDGPDKTYLLRKHREVAMWANVAVSRNADGSPRQ